MASRRGVQEACHQKYQTMMPMKPNEPLPSMASVDAKATLAPLTQRARLHSLRHFMQTLSDKGETREWESVTADDIDHYVQSQRGLVGARTLQNRMCHIRSHLREIGRGQLADSMRLTSVALAISDASRDGKHQPLGHSDFELVIQRAQAIDPGFACALQLQRELGLRSTEAILCGPSLKRWAHDLALSDRVLVTEGTKTNTPRQAIATNPQRALLAVNAALKVLKAHGKLIWSSTLEGSQRAYFRRCKTVGLIGVHSNEALRLMYVQERYAFNLQLFGNRHTALSATCLDIGYSEARLKHVQKVFQL